MSSATQTEEMDYYFGCAGGRELGPSTLDFWEAVGRRGHQGMGLQLLPVAEEAAHQSTGELPIHPPERHHPQGRFPLGGG